MLNSFLSEFGQDRAVELLGYVLILLALTSVGTLGLVLANQINVARRNRRQADRTNEIVRHLGRSIFGEEGWAVVESTAARDGRQIDSILPLLEVEAFDSWSENAIDQGLLSRYEAERLRAKMSGDLVPASSPGEGPARSNVPIAPRMPISVAQEKYEVRGAIADVYNAEFRVWLLDNADGISEAEPALFTVLSRSGPHQFESRFSWDQDGSILVKSPDTIDHQQKRRFVRYPVALPAKVRTYLSGTSGTKTRITDLGGGGATISNPDGEYSIGNVIEIGFRAASKDYVVIGRVIRTSNDAQFLHLRFEAIKDHLREQIASSVVYC